jgi:hypothetical protein
MRERALSTLAIWLSVAVSIYFLLERLTYTYEIASLDVDGRNIVTPVTEVAPTLWQIAIFGLIFLIICCAFGASAFIWQYAHLSGQAPDQQEKASAKLKRDQKARVRKLLEQMDDDDLDALESRLSDDGEIVSVDELLEQGELQRRR